MLHWHVSVLIREFLSSTFLNPFFQSSLIRNHNRSWVPTQSVMVNQWKICVGTTEWNLKPNHRGWRLTLVPVTIMNDFPQFGTPSECWTREIHQQNVVSSSQRCSGDFVSIFAVPWFNSKFPRIRYVYALNISLFLMRGTRSDRVHLSFYFCDPVKITITVFVFHWIQLWILFMAAVCMIQDNQLSINHSFTANVSNSVIKGVYTVHSIQDSS